MQAHLGVLERIVRSDDKLRRGQHLRQALAGEADQRGDRGRRHLAPDRSGRSPAQDRSFVLFAQCISGGIIEHGDQFGAETVAPIHAAHAGKRHGGGRHQLPGHLRLRRFGQAGQVCMDGPPGKPHHAQVVKIGYSADPPAKNRNGRFLHGEVVVVARLGLAVFECAFSRGAFSEEEIGIGVPGDFQPGTQPFVVVRSST